MKLSDISPVAAMVTGEGWMNKAMRQGFGGLLPQAIAKDSYQNKEDARRAAEARAEAEAQAVAEARAAQGMKRGGKVKSIDGIAIRGKTRAKLKGK